MKKLLQLLRDNPSTERQPIVLVRNEAEPMATLWVYDVIDKYWGVNALDIAKALAGLDPAITLRVKINSPGGDIFEARAAATAIKEFGGKTVSMIDGVAASAASWFAMSADEVEISDGAYLMIHNAFGGCYGNKDDMLSMHNLLAKVESDIAQKYAKDTGQSVEQIQQWLDAETWFTAQEAVAAGFADRVTSTVIDQPTNVKKGVWNLAAFDKTPEGLLKPKQPVIDNTAALLAHNERRLQLLQFA